MIKTAKFLRFSDLTFDLLNKFMDNLMQEMMQEMFKEAHPSKKGDASLVPDDMKTTIRFDENMLHIYYPQVMRISGQIYIPTTNWF